MDYDRFRIENPEYMHCIEIPRGQNNLTTIASCAKILNQMSLKMFRNYKTTSTSTHNVYWFKDYEHATVFQEKATIHVK